MDKFSTAKAMRELPLEDREAAIQASTNVIGYERFQQKNKQVALREAYRKPVKPD